MPVQKGILPWLAPCSENILKRKLPQSLMIIGRLGDGLKELCIHLSASILSGNNGNLQEMVLRGDHPDFHLIKQEENSTGKVNKYIVIDQIRQLINKAYLMPSIAQMRIIAIYPACRLNRSSSNALLKLLEEPPPASMLILGVERPHLLPTTIRSRCQLFRIPTPSPRTSLNWLRKETSLENPEAALKLASHAPLDATVYGELIKPYKLLAKYCLGEEDIVDLQPELIKLEPEIWLPWVISWAVSGAMLASNLQPEKTLIPVAEQIEEKFPTTLLKWTDLHDKLQEMLEMSDYPVVNRLLIERCVFLFLQLRQR